MISNSKPVAAAQFWIGRSFLPVPVRPGSKKPHNPDDARGRGWQNLRITEETAGHYFNGSEQNIGVLLGDDFGSADIDLDCPEAVSAAPTFLPETGMKFGRSSKPASHWFYRIDPPIPSEAFKDPTDRQMLVELRCQDADGSIGHQTVVPPSVHESGEAIRFEPGFDREPANVDAPALQQAVRKIAATALLARHWPRAGGGRHEAMLALAGVLQRAGLDLEEAVRFCVAVYRAVRDHDPNAIMRTESEVRDTFQNAATGRATTGVPKLREHVDPRIFSRVLEWLGAEAAKSSEAHKPPGSAPLDKRNSLVAKCPASLLCASSSKDPADLLHQPFNDYGNAQRIIAMHGEDLRFCHATNKWQVWDLRRWCSDESDLARRKAHETMLEFARQALAAGSEAAAKFAGSCLNNQRVSSALREAEPYLAVTPNELDAHTYLLNLRNGTVDLRTGDLRPHSRSHLITRVLEYDFIPTAQCPTFLRFLDRVMGGGPDAGEGDLQRSSRLVDQWQKILGYALTGNVSEKVVFVLIGTGNNGKTTLLATFMKVLGSYARLLQIDTLMTRQESNNAQADLADLRGARFVMTSETEEDQRLAEGKLKRITQGMGKIKAARKYENPIEFPETHKLFIDANHKPAVRGTDNAIWNRLYPIPFSVTISPDKIDRDLPNKLLAEAEGILAWAVEGAARWYRDGLGSPPEVVEANREWRGESDHLMRFMEEQCVHGDAFTVKAGVLYSSYKAWCASSGERELSLVAFGRRLAEQGIVKRKRESTGYRYLGVALRAE